MESALPTQCFEVQCSVKEIVMTLQLALPLDESSQREDPLRRAWVRSGLVLPYELAKQDRAIAICLRCLADAMQKKPGRKRRR